MPTGVPRAIVYDPAFACHLSVVVRRDKSCFSFFCGDHDVLEEFPIGELAKFRRILAKQTDVQVVSWIEVTDDGL
jgi:hypothetical protein